MDDDPGLFENLARDGVFEALTGLHEAGDGRITPGGPARLATEQRALAVRDEHDHRRVDAREGLRGAGRIGAAHDMSGALRLAGRTADAAVPMPPLPIGERPRVGQEAGLFAIEQGRQGPQLLEAGAGRWRYIFADLHQYAARLAIPAEQHPRLERCGADGRVIRPYKGDRRVLTADGVGSATREQEEGSGIRDRRGPPVGFLA